MEKDLISLLIPTYNVAKYLKDTFESIRRQTYKKLQPIFVDDGSTDDTQKLLDEFKKEYPNAIVIHQKNTGISGARNAAMKAATGEYIYIFDPDDSFHPSMLENLYNLMKQYDADSAICRYKKTKESFNYCNKHFKNMKINKAKVYTGKDAITAQYLSSAKFAHAPWNKLYKHEIIKKFPSYPEVFIKDCLYLEDVPFSAQYYSYTNKVVYIKNAFYFFRQRKNSNTHSNFNERKLTVYNGWKGYDCLDAKEFPETQIYIKVKYCVDDFMILYLLRNSDYNDKELVKVVYARFKENLKYFIRAKRLQWYKKYLMWASIFYIRPVVRKKLK